MERLISEESKMTTIRRIYLGYMIIAMLHGAGVAFNELEEAKYLDTACNG
jgi:hypothetical protein